MMKTLKSCVQCVEIKCPGTTMDFSPVKAARCAPTLLPEKQGVQSPSQPLGSLLKLNWGGLF